MLPLDEYLALSVRSKHEKEENGSIQTLGNGQCKHIFYINPNFSFFHTYNNAFRFRAPLYVFNRNKCIHMSRDGDKIKL